MTRVALAHVSAALQTAGLLHGSTGEPPVEITGISDDSRSAARGGLFVAVRGTALDGHDYLRAAADAGAAVAIVEDPSRSTLPTLVVSDSRRAASIAAAAYYNDPARTLTTIAVTGTNGKTTTVALLRHLFDEPGAHAASIGTLGVRVGSEGRTFEGGGGLTTPGPVELQRALRALADSDVRTVAIEASSHALHQHRLDAVKFNAVVFTSFTRDHLDYHETMEAYFAAKARLVEQVSATGVAVVNADDRAWAALPRAHRTVTFGLGARADIRADDTLFASHGSSWTLIAPDGKHPVDLPLIGDFNVVNALGAAATAIALGRTGANVAARLKRSPQVPGRLERIADSPVVLRDYAHTPDALERAILAVKPFAERGRVIVVFSCGGDRDPGKRPQMGAIAERLADFVMLTSDNPRTEDPEHIIDQIEAGMTRGLHERIEDRRAAIARVLEIADPQHDLVLLAGKGHETYQIRGKVRHPFDEADVVNRLLAERVR